MEALLRLNAADEQTQMARREAARGKKVLFITCFLADYLYKRDKPLFQHVATFGSELYFVFGTEEKDKAAASMFERDGLVTGSLLYADMADENSAGDNIVAAARASGVVFDAVFCPYEHAMTLMGEVAEKLGLHGNPASAYINARDKRVSREVCTKAGVAAPRFARVSERDTVAAAVEHVGLPLVLKPSSGASSDGVYRCNTLEDVLMRFDSVAHELKTNFLFNWSPGCEACVLLEEYIDGDEFDVDVMLWNGETVYANAIDNYSCPEPYFMETGSACPTLYTGKRQQQLLDYSSQCVKALGFDHGLFHVEIKYSMKRSFVDADGETLGQPLLIEVNPRMGGGRTHLFHKEVYGVDIFENFFLSALNIPINPPRASVPKCAIGDYEICAEKTGVLLHTRFLDHIKNHPNVTECKVHLQAGAEVQGLDTGIPEWLGFYIVKGETAEEVNALIYDLAATINPPIVPHAEKDTAAFAEAHAHAHTAQAVAH
eukprot:comp20581_c0_seq1/m.26497 comp20581_c0_seq1/g.26497  ORF comp20581_c0_seq1/g.26497 comp20581_c0_seq1/m.26497 type:complete len:488 (-) comp20581_c0_seq1:288-1751(-)